MDQEFMPLNSRVHVHNLVGQSAESTQHGTVCSPLIPYYENDGNALGYLVRLDQPLRICGATEDEIGVLAVVFVHYSSLSYLGGDFDVADLIVEGESTQEMEVATHE